ncbi:MAG: FecR family protein [Spirosomataceae bacterium]
MSKVQFKALLKRYIAGKCSPEEQQIVEQWYLLLDDGQPLNDEAYNEHELEEELWNRIQAKSQLSKQVPVMPLNRRRWWSWAVAASVIMMLGIWTLWHNQVSVESDGLATIVPSQDIVSQTNTTDTPLVITLPDDSQVQLASHATIEYPKHFEATKREVFISGDAFFKITRHPEQPFMVYTHDVVTKVLGTSFWVKTAQSNKQVEVSVVTGKVTVFKREVSKTSEKAPNGVILTPNQRVTYFADNQLFVTNLVEQPVLVRPEQSPQVQDPSFVYDETPLSNVLKDLEKAYDVEIIIENEQMNSCPFTADLSKHHLFTQLDLICSSLQATYEVRGTKILVMGRGCE